MSPVDLVIIGCYLLATLGIGLYYRRFADKSLENFFLAGREVPGWLNGVSYAAAMVSADAATAYGGLAAVTGIFVCWWYLTRICTSLNREHLGEESTDMLREAQKHPEKYADLVVRVAGYSARFVELNPDTQEDIIARTVHTL